MVINEETYRSFGLLQERTTSVWAGQGMKRKPQGEMLQKATILVSDPLQEVDKRVGIAVLNETVRMLLK